MAKNAKQSVTMTRKEKWLGFGYMIFSLFLLPYLLDYANGLLAEPMEAGTLNIVYFCTNFLFVCYIFRSFLKRSLFFAGEHLGNCLTHVVLGFGIYWLCTLAYSCIILVFFPDYVNLNDQSIGGILQENFALMSVCSIILVPVSEELLFRGVLFGNIQTKNRIAAYVVTVAFFAGIHLVNYVGAYSLRDLVLAFCQYIPASVVLAWAYQKSGCIYVPILIHSIINAIGTFAMR